MIQPLLSILIPTVVGREELFRGIINRIGVLSQMATGKSARYTDSVQYHSGICTIVGSPKDFMIEVQYIRDNKEITIGEKREELYKMANGLYSWQIDDDDDISGSAIALILEAIKQNQDCITFEESVSIDGINFKSNHSLSYSGWEGDGKTLLSDGFHFHRTPFFKSVIKTEIARSVPIPHIRWGEDNIWADKLHEHLHSEIHIPEQIYRYIHISSPHNERYGIQ